MAASAAVATAAAFQPRPSSVVQAKWAAHHPRLVAPSFCPNPPPLLCQRAALSPRPPSTTAGSFQECACDKGLECPANNCTTTVYVGHRGSDKPGRTMQTGYQIQQINQYSITSFFWKLIDGVRSPLQLRCRQLHGRHCNRLARGPKSRQGGCCFSCSVHHLEHTCPAYMGLHPSDCALIVGSPANLPSCSCMCFAGALHLGCSSAPAICLRWLLPMQVLNVFGNSGLTDSAGAQSTAPVVLGGTTEADVAAAQAAQQEQGQPLAAGSR